MKESSIRHQSIVCIDIERRKSRTGGISTMSEIDPFSFRNDRKKSEKEVSEQKSVNFESPKNFFFTSEEKRFGSTILAVKLNL